MFKWKKWVKILESRNKDAFDQADRILKNAGLDTKAWASEPMPVGGCGAQMRPADWSGKKPAVRVRKNDMIYHLAVTADHEAHARKLLEAAHENGDGHDAAL